jgi:hypothetical protein
MNKERRSLISAAVSHMLVVTVSGNKDNGMWYGLLVGSKEELRYRRKNLPRCHFIRHKYHIDCSEVGNGPPRVNLISAACLGSW